MLYLSHVVGSTSTQPSPRCRTSVVPGGGVRAMLRATRQVDEQQRCQVYAIGRVRGCPGTRRAGREDMGPDRIALLSGSGRRDHRRTTPPPSVVPGPTTDGSRGGRTDPTGPTLRVVSGSTSRGARSRLATFKASAGGDESVVGDTRGVSESSWGMLSMAVTKCPQVRLGCSMPAGDAPGAEPSGRGVEAGRSR